MSVPEEFISVPALNVKQPAEHASASMDFKDAAELSLVAVQSNMVYCRHLVFTPATVSTGNLMISWISEIHNMLTEDLTLNCAMQCTTPD